MISHSLTETENIAKEWLQKIVASRAWPAEEASVFGLSGHLGSGKTAFTKAVSHLLGVTETITSPTFVIMKMYEIPIHGLEWLAPREKDVLWKRLVHIDAYRLEKPEELEVLAFEKLVSDPHNLILLEWPENVRDALPSSAQTIRFETLGEGQREIIF